MMMGENTEASAMHEGLQVYTVGHLMPRGSYQEEAGQAMYSPDGNVTQAGAGGSGGGGSAGKKKKGGGEANGIPTIIMSTASY